MVRGDFDVLYRREERRPRVQTTKNDYNLRKELTELKKAIQSFLSRNLTLKSMSNLVETSATPTTSIFFKIVLSYNPQYAEANF